MRLVALLACVAAASACFAAPRDHAALPIIAAPPPEPSIALDDVLALHALVMADSFPALEQRLAWHADSARIDTGYEGRYRADFDVFAVSDTAMQPHLDAWVARDTLSPVARLARATFLGVAAGNARGSAVAAKTSSEQFAAMHRWHELELADIKAARRIDSTNVMSYFLALGTAMGSVNDETMRGILDEGLRQVPGSLLLRFKYMHSITPRWGGSLDQIDRYARSTDTAAAANPRLKLLRGFRAYAEGADSYSANDELGAARLYTQALRYGDHWQYRYDRANAYFFAKEYQLAVDDYTAALAGRPAMVWARARRAASYDYLAFSVERGPTRDSLIALGRGDIDVSKSLDAADSELLHVLSRHPALTPH